MRISELCERHPVDQMQIAQPSRRTLHIRLKLVDRIAAGHPFFTSGYDARIDKAIRGILKNLRFNKSTQ